MFHSWNQAFRIICFLGWCPNINPAWWWEQCEGWPIWQNYVFPIIRWPDVVIITSSFPPFSAVFSNQRFSNCSTTMNVVGFVKLSSDCFCANSLQDEYEVLLSPLLQYFCDLQTQSPSMYGDSFHLVMAFYHYSPYLMFSHDLYMSSKPWKLLLWIHLIKWPFWLQMLQLNVHQQNDLFEYLRSLPFCSTFIQTVTKYNL